MFLTTRVLGSWWSGGIMESFWQLQYSFAMLILLYILTYYVYVIINFGEVM
jgi:hypothetical protein